MAWILTLETSPDHVDELSEQLWVLETTGIAEVPTPGGPNNVRVLAGFQTEPGAEAARSELGGSITPVDNTAWAGPGVADVTVGGDTISIEAGQSFGHGSHPTTRLCLDALGKHLINGQTVLDVGCGSGVLALAAKARGAADVTAIDIDPNAIAATEHNARANGIEIRVTDTSIEKLEGPFDVIVANMLVAELEPIANAVQRLAGGLIVLSGALISQTGRWSAMFDGCTTVEETSAGEWGCSVVRVHD